jgi:hypothetical protein
VLAWLTSWFQGNLGGAIAAFVFLPWEAPRYRTGHLILMSTTTMSCVLSVLMTIYLRRENARRNATHKPAAEYSYSEMELEKDKGDSATFFRYTV